MKWNKFRLTTTTEAEDIVSSMLMDLGIQGVEIEDKVPLTQSDKEQMFVDILPETEADDGVAYLSFYLEEDEDKEKVFPYAKIANDTPTETIVKTQPITLRIYVKSEAAQKSIKRKRYRNNANKRMKNSVFMLWKWKSCMSTNHRVKRSYIRQT